MFHYLKYHQNSTILACIWLAFLTPKAALGNDQLCWDEAGKRYNVDPLLLYSIAQVESNLNPKAFNDNVTTQDHGLMQINSWWLQKLKDYDISLNDLYEPCININIGAWILNHSFAKYGATWNGVGAYNAGTAKTQEADARRAQYASKVYKQYQINMSNRNIQSKHYFQPAMF